MLQPLLSLIEGEIQALAAFVGLLRDEQERLKAGETDQLAALAARKDERIRELVEFAARRDAGCTAAGLATDPSSLKTWAADRGVAATRALKHLLDLAREARELNELNGQLVALRLAHTRAALAALTSRPSDPGVYGSSGQAMPPTGYRLIDSA